MESLTFIVLIVSKKIATLKFLPHMNIWQASKPNNDHYKDSHFSSESRNKTNNNKKKNRTKTSMAELTRQNDNSKRGRARTGQVRGARRGTSVLPAATPPPWRLEP